MKTSILIMELQLSLKEHGDIPVKFVSEAAKDSEDGDTVTVAGLATMLHDDDTASYVLICDQDSIDGLRG